ncbi:cation-translocating P-type ATPase [Clostridium cylindrosporum]|uniref:Calcium-transporting ATPase 1 n=1 Tax=Clostridium cylindrosporum DSM 605 TaxID=1121307 RepID=A0A0J8DDG3_CLOCY|nr:cation-translocating P-type ATPase [Clostridium cylindrosporum]KMT22274.1 calcium-transporting ATPase 1 [Clostridium cylindrosporum DSM 605]
MEFFQKSFKETLEEFQVEPDKGLGEVQIRENREKHGSNEFSKGEKVTLLSKILEALKEPMIFILIIAALITIGMNVYKTFQGLHAEFTESIGILVAITLSVGITIIMEGRSEKAFETLNSINDDVKVKVLRNGIIQYVGKKDLVVGDIIKIETGDKIPADGRLIDSLQLKIDESMLTGESIAVSKNFNEVLEDPKTSLSQRINMVFSGTFVTYGQGTAIVTSVGDKTEMGSIANELKDTDSKSTPLQEKLDKLARSITTLGVIAAVLIFVYEIFKIYISNTLSFDTIQSAFMTSVALIVAAVPEGLPTIVAMTLALNIIKMARTNALVRKLIACETVGCINVICSDKTGTLTKNQMTVIDVYSNGEIVEPKNLKNSFMIENFTINSTADINIKDGNVKFIGNPTECSLLKAFSDTICSMNPSNCKNLAEVSCTCTEKCTPIAIGGENISYTDIRNSYNIAFQYPFSSDKKSMTTVVDETSAYKVYTKGSPEKIISLCNRIIINNRIEEFTDELKILVGDKITKLQQESKRILAFAHNIIDTSYSEWDKVQDEVESNMIFDGFVSIADPLRDDVFDAVKKCKKSGINLKMLTGDNIVTATSIAKQLDIVKKDSIIVEAQEIDEMPDEKLLEIIDRIVVIARSKPITKMRIVNLLKKHGNVVAVTGDGINDAPALKNADVGIAMGITGTEVSKEASDIILLDDSFSTIVKSVEWGRGIYENFQRFIQFQLTVNLVAVLTVFVCEILSLPLPFTTMQLLWVNLIMDGPPALSLGLESLRKHLMNQEPVKRSANIITKNMLSTIILNGTYIVIMMMLVIKGNILGASEAEHTSVIFTTFVMFQLFNAFNARELGNESVFTNLLKNKSMVIIMIATFALQVLITEFGGSLFKTAPLPLDMWMKVIAYSFSIVIFSEIIRLIKRLFKK